MEFGSAVILAGGKSSRMGFDKQFLQFRNRSLLRFHGRTLSELFDQIIVVTNSPQLYQGTNFTLVSDEVRDKGPLAGLHVGLKAARSHYVYLLACDMPYLNLDYVRFMQQRLQAARADICVTQQGDYLEPFNAFYSRQLVPDIETYLSRGRQSLFRFIRSHDTLYISEQEARGFSPDWGMFLNLNTRQEFEQWRRSGAEGGFAPHAVGETVLS
jgi:molybdopterin-guanine dinucleotide biosynthesis protein A